MPQPINYDEIIESLTLKTDEGKISWTQVFSTSAFTCSVDAEFTFKVQRSVRSDGTYYRLTMTDKENNEIFDVEEDADYGRRLGNLHEAARRVALNVEDKVNAVKAILKRI